MMVDIIICDIGTISERFYLLKVPYPHGYCKIILFIYKSHNFEKIYNSYGKNLLNLKM